MARNRFDAIFEEIAHKNTRKHVANFLDGTTSILHCSIENAFRDAPKDTLKLVKALKEKEFTLTIVTLKLLVQLSCFDAARFLMDNGVPLDSCYDNGDTILHILRDPGPIYFVLKEAEKRNIDLLSKVNKKRENALHIALNREAFDTRTAGLSFIVTYWMLKFGGDEQLYVEDKRGISPISYLAVIRDNCPHKPPIKKWLLGGPAPQMSKILSDKWALYHLQQSIRDDDIEFTKFLMQFFPDGLNFQFLNGFTPLTFATQYAGKDIVSSLIGNRAAVNFRDRHGNLPIHAAAHYGNLAVARVLVKNNSHVNDRKPLKNTPLDYCLERLCTTSDEQFSQCRRLFLFLSRNGSRLGVYSFSILSEAYSLNDEQKTELRHLENVYKGICIFNANKPASSVELA